MTRWAAFIAAMIALAASAAAQDVAFRKSKIADAQGKSVKST